MKTAVKTYDEWLMEQVQGNEDALVAEYDDPAWRERYEEYVRYMEYTTIRNEEMRETREALAATVIWHSTSPDGHRYPTIEEIIDVLQQEYIIVREHAEAYIDPADAEYYEGQAGGILAILRWICTGDPTLGALRKLMDE